MAKSAREFPAVSDGRLFIDGDWRDAADGKTAPTINPADGREIARIAQATETDVDAAVGAARKAFDEGPWRGMNVHERGALLSKVADLIERDAQEIGYLETIDMGKPITYSTNVDVPIAAQIFRYMAGAATRLDGATRQGTPPTFNYTLREPLGVVTAITPFNFPLLLSLTKITPALAAGTPWCTSHRRRRRCRR
jgi:aldehyde dehydrogenase (NAD+)